MQIYWNKRQKKRIGYDWPPFYMADVTSSANAHLRQPNTNLTFQYYSILYVSFFTNSLRDVVVSTGLAFCFVFVFL